MHHKATFYADTEVRLAQVAKACDEASERGDTVGLDTEFSGVHVGKQSCVARAKCHIWSLALPLWPHQITARGVLVCQPVVLPAAALGHPEIRLWLEGPGAKAVHNLPVDAHTLHNHAIKLGGGINTLSLARWAWPERARGAGFTLDALGRDFLGVGKLSSYGEIFSEDVVEYTIRNKRIAYCECGAVPCKRRSTTPGHRRLERVEETRIPKTVVREIPMESVGPGHAKWPQAVEYAAQDAVLAQGVFELAQQAMAGKLVDAPWL